jgi:hypothetical protein
MKTATGDGDHERLCDVVNTVDADRATVRNEHRVDVTSVGKVSGE